MDTSIDPSDSFIHVVINFLVAVSTEFLIVHTYVNKYRSDHAIDREP